jgi:hypothetical protein
VLLDVSRHRDGLDVFQALSVPSFWQPLVIGLIILFGVIVDTYRRRFSEVRRGGAGAALESRRKTSSGRARRHDAGRKERHRRTGCVTIQFQIWVTKRRQIVR